MGLTDRPRPRESVSPPESPARSGIDGFTEDLEQTEEHHLRGRCLSYVRALSLLRSIFAGPQRVEPIMARLAQVWGPRSFPAYHQRPLLMLASLRAEAMTSHHHPLSPGFATRDPDPLAVTREALVESLSPARAGVWFSLASRLPQPNELARAVVWKWPAELAGCGAGGRPLGLVDVGASAGLNLVADLVPDGWEDATGAPLRVVSGPRVVMRIGFDVHPLDVSLESDVAWARACIWPGAADRVTRFDRAVEAWCDLGRKLEAPPTLLSLNASLVPSRLPGLLAQMPESSTLFVYQTLARDAMEPSKRARYEEGMRQWLAGVPRGRAAWLEAETTHQAAALAIVAHLPDGAGGVRSLTLGVTDVHPRLIDVHAQAASDFAAFFKAAPISGSAAPARPSRGAGDRSA